MTDGPSIRPEPGLCGTCRHSRRVETARGSVFRLCERSVTDARFPRYPALPVLRCPGFEPTETTEPTDDAAAAVQGREPRGA
jgi:hypothetical protein